MRCARASIFGGANGTGQVGGGRGLGLVCILVCPAVVVVFPSASDDNLDEPLSAFLAAQAKPPAVTPRATPLITATCPGTVRPEREVCVPDHD